MSLTHPGYCEACHLPWDNHSLVGGREVCPVRVGELVNYIARDGSLVRTLVPLSMGTDAAAPEHVEEQPSTGVYEDGE